jgi:hypothetical protein
MADKQPDLKYLGYATHTHGETTQASCRLDTAISDLVDRLAEKQGWTRSQTLRHLVVVGLGVMQAER